MYRKYKCDVELYANEIDKKDYHEYLFIAVDFDSHAISARRDAWCTIPLFYGIKNSQFILSNEFSYVADIVCKQEVRLSGQCIVESILSLNEDDRTILADVFILPGRSLLTCDDKKKIKIIRPKSIDWPNDNTINISKKEIISRMHKHLKNTIRFMRNRIGSHIKLGFELSGGLDTAVVVGTSANIGIKPIKTYSLILPSTQGESQNIKSNEMKTVFGIQNKIISAGNFIH